MEMSLALNGKFKTLWHKPRQKTSRSEAGVTIIRLNGTDDGDVFTDEGTPFDERLVEVLGAMPTDASVVVLIHGMRYSWRQGVLYDPQRTLYAVGDAGDRSSWPARLGFAGDQQEPCGNVCIAFGWDAPGLGGIRSAHQSAARSACALAQVFEITTSFGRRVDVLAHSLGGALLFEAQRLAPCAAVRRAVLLGPAARRSAGRQIAVLRPETEFLHVMARANDIFDEAYHRLSRDGQGGSDLPLGYDGLGVDRENWLDLQIDDDVVRGWLAACGFGPTPRARRISHWLFYEDDAAMAFYREVLCEAAPSCLAKLRACGPSRRIAPRWSRLAAAPRLGAWLFPQKQWQDESASVGDADSEYGRAFGSGAVMAEQMSSV